MLKSLKYNQIHGFAKPAFYGCCQTGYSLWAELIPQSNEFMDKPFSQACENNKQPILERLQVVLADCQSVLEIGSGTGQHAVYMGTHMPHLSWQTSDLVENHTGIEAWLNSAKLNNVFPPLVLDANADHWPTTQYDAVFSANTLHIMGWDEVERFFQKIQHVIADDGLLCIYGPFNYGGEYTSASNARFDVWLAQQHPKSAIRDFEKVNALAEDIGLALVEDYEMPANNRLLVWRRNQVT